MEVVRLADCISKSLPMTLVVRFQKEHENRKAVSYEPGVLA